MKITKVESLHCDAGWRNLSFLKITTDRAGLVGWSEYNESYGSAGLSAVIDGMADTLIGRDPRQVGAISAFLYAGTRAAHGGLIQQAIAAIENALVDIKAKDLGVPVYDLLGGKVRDRLRLYWSHCGSYRFQHADIIGKPRLKNLDDLRALGDEVAQAGFGALKTNIFRFDVPEPYMHQPGFNRGPGGPELNWDGRLLRNLRSQLHALREGAGVDMDIQLDLNFNFKTEGYRQACYALDNLDLAWVEIDLYDPAALALVRAGCSTPIASLESIFGRRGFRPYLEHQAVDVAIVDVPWNGILESRHIAAMCEAYEVNCAPHNFYGHLSTLMSAHFCASLPNFRIMEIDIDDVPWKDELVTVPPVIERGHLVVPDTPGWGAEIDEKAVKKHPPKRKGRR
jgi:L-alanine-DL-glutamate epimerase-like enolase superfamily enzyme